MSTIKLWGDYIMKINQIYSLLNDINKQMWGEDAVDVNNLSGIISMGETIIGNTDNTDLFLGKLVDRIGLVNRRVIYGDGTCVLRRESICAHR